MRLRQKNPAIDFVGHVSVFGADSLRELINCYEQVGGKVWDHLYEQALARYAAAPLIYAHFAITHGLPTHIEAAKAQLASL